MNNKQITKGYKMRKAMVIREEKNTSILPIIGGLMIGFAVIDFAMSFAGVNLTSFLVLLQDFHH